ncbi:helix-turn-helix domain-containing protein [Vibrio cholerae]|uniref:helix-turn-helix domain-containing protein n=1 Tax=Vibrio cholerae TaxID=666 RepID=UPI0022F2A873|nr:helix-turn-helix domain-containing protein [Vibrio cholerae]MDA5316674.1 helix-turn-helix domain-containing protein [Vibrio cholerae]
MSRAANDWAWSLDIKPASLKLLLLAMADRADEDHCCFPSIPRLEKDTGLNRKTILSGIKKLVECGVLKDTGEKRGRTMRVIVYKLVGVETGIKKLDARTIKTAPVEMEPISEQYQNWNDSENGTLNSPENGTLNSTENGTQNQSLEPVIEPIKDLVPSELETDKPAEPVLFEIPLKGKSSIHGVTQSELFEYRDLYPAVDVAQQIRNMIGWCKANPTRQKTSQGIKRFIHAWLSKEQDRGRVAPASQATSAPDEVQKLKAKIRQLEIDINSENAALLRFQSHKNHASEIAASSCQRKLNEMLQQREALLAELSRA